MGQCRLRHHTHVVRLSKRQPALCWGSCVHNRENLTLSQLSNLELTELIARTPDQYVDMVVRLASDLPRLADLRANLRERMLRSPLTDAVRFTRNIEAAYRDIWQRWCQSTGNY